MDIIFLGLYNNQFNYHVKLNGHKFDYFTGIGWVSLSKPKQEDMDKYARLDIADSQHIMKENTRFNRLITHDQMIRNTVYRRKPTESDVLECLKSDCEAGSMSFDDFCDNFGYDNDSIKALDIYRDCMDTAKKLRGYKFPEGLGE